MIQCSIVLLSVQPLQFLQFAGIEDFLERSMRAVVIFFLHPRKESIHFPCCFLFAHGIALFSTFLVTFALYLVDDKYLFFLI